MRAVSQIVAALALVIIAAGAAAIYFSVVNPLISRPSGGVAISLSKDLEIDLYGSTYNLIIYVRVVNPLTYAVQINRATALIIFNGPNTASMIPVECSTSGDAPVRPGSIDYIRFSCTTIFQSSPIANHICVAYTGSPSCTITAKMISDVMKMASIASLVIYYSTPYGYGSCPIFPGDIYRCY